MIKLPADYVEARVQRIECFGAVPQSVIIRHEAAHALILVSVRCRRGGDSAYHLGLDPLDRPLEDAWEEYRAEFDAQSPDALRGMVGLMQGLVRLALSSCLMTMVYGAACVGPDSPSQRARLERHLQAARRSGDAGRVRNAEFDLRALPMRYRFAQDVRLYRLEEAPARPEGAEPTGRTVAPHWRRGHIRMQTCGPGLSQRRRIAVPAVLVNGHLFLGERAEASATYYSPDAR